MTVTANPPATEEWLDSTGGRILTRYWEPKDRPRASLVMCHGVNSHGGQYIRAGEIFAGRGYAATTLDLRGRGQSDGERFYIENVSEYVTDLALTIEHARARHPDLPVYLLGHSAGGVTSVSYALDYQERIAGLICESFAFRVYAPDFGLTLLRAASHIAPRLPVLKLKMEDFSRDPAWVAELNADPLCKGEKQPIGTVAALVRAGQRFEKEFGTITLPVLIMHGTADKATRPDGSKQFFDETGSSDKELKLYDGYYHDLLNDIGREQIFDDIDSWIGARLPVEQSVSMPGPTGTA